MTNVTNVTKSSSDRGEARGRSGLRFGRLGLPIFRRRTAGEVVQQVLRRMGDSMDRLLERLVVGLLRLGGPGDLAHVLQRRRHHLVRGRRRVEVVEHMDVPTHAERA